MHTSSYTGMRQLIGTYVTTLPKGAKVLDVGSADVNGSYRPLFKGLPCTYIGADLAAGSGVDLVMPSEYSFGLPDASIHAVISGQCLEHCRNPFKLVAEMYRVCVPGAWCLLVAPWSWKEHKHPWDCFRFLPDGMRSVMESAGFTVLKTCITGLDCWGIAKKGKIT
jgi:SAM-dependent methyltransferase